MIYFHCKFLLDNGQKLVKIIPAEDHASLMDKLADQQGVMMSTVKLPSRAFKMSTTDLIFFFTYLREFLNAEIHLVEAVETIAEETRKLNIKAIASKLQHDIHTGYLLSDAMRNQSGVFSNITTSLVAISEKINALSSACDHIVHYLNFGVVLARKVRAVIMYPIVMFLMVFGMIVFYSKFVIPKLEAVFTEFASGGSADTMPLQTKALVWLAAFISEYWLIVLSFATLLPLFILMFYRKSFRCKVIIDGLLLKIPFISNLIIKSQIARFSLFTANMYDRGYNFLDSITEGTIVITNEKMKNDFEIMIDNIKTGDAVYRALRQIPYIPRFAHRMFRVAELTSNVSRPLHTIYDFYSQEIQNDLEKILRVVKPISIIIIGGLMFWIISATLLPFYTKIPTLLEGSHV